METIRKVVTNQKMTSKLVMIMDYIGDIFITTKRNQKLL